MASLWRRFFGMTTPTVGIQSPWTAPNAFETIAAEEVLGDLAAQGAVTREIALRVPGVKRAHGIHCSLVAGLPFYLMDGDQKAAEQPRWLTNSDSGVSPYHRMYGITSDLYFNGWACLGFTQDMEDALHIPVGMWSLAPTGEVVVNDAIPEKYRARPIAIPLGYGANGILVDGADSIRAARAIERAWIDRVENPIPQTDLHVTNADFDNMTRKEKFRVIRDFNKGRKLDGGSTTLTPSYLEVRALGTVDAGLFEKGRNAVRLDIANHSAVPASIIEGSKDSGGSDIEYSNDANNRSELYDFGSKGFVQAFEGRLSLDDVCGPGQSIRADLSGITTFPSPSTNPTSAD